MAREARGRALALLVAVAVLAASPAAAEVYRLEVAGLACPFCAYGIEKELAGLDGVAGVETEIERGAVIVTTRDDARLDRETARAAVRAAGFTLDGFRRVESPE